MNGKPRLQWWSAPGCAVAAVCLAVALVGCAPAGEVGNGGAAPAAAPTSPLGAYLAARHAQEEHDYGDAAEYMERTLNEDPGNFDLLRRTLVLRVSEGRVAEAAPLARGSSSSKAMAACRGLPCWSRRSRKAISTPPHSVPRRCRAKAPSASPRRCCSPGARSAASALRRRSRRWSSSTSSRPRAAARSARRADRRFRRPDRRGRAGRLYEARRAATRRRPGALSRSPAISSSATAQREADAGSTSGSAAATPAASRGRWRSAHRQGRRAAAVIASPQRRRRGGAVRSRQPVQPARDPRRGSPVYARLALDLGPDFPLAQLLAGRDPRDPASHRRGARRTIARSIRNRRSAGRRGCARRSALDALDRTDEAAISSRAMADERPLEPEPLVELGDLLRAHTNSPTRSKAYDAAHRAPRAIRGPNGGSSTAAAWRWSAPAIGRAPKPISSMRWSCSRISRWCSTISAIPGSTSGEHLAEGLRMVKRAVELRPDDGYIVDSLGWAYYRLGDFGTRRKRWRRRSSCCPRIPPSTTISAMPIGKRAASRGALQWRRALQFKPEADKARRSKASSIAASRSCRRRRRRAAAERASPMTRRRPAPAKLNLYLHVLGRRADGYHLLDSLVAFAAVGDEVDRRAGAGAVAQRRRAAGAGAGGRPDDNLVWRAAELLASEAGRAPAAALTLSEFAGRFGHRRRLERCRGDLARARCVVAARPRRGAARRHRRAARRRRAGLPGGARVLARRHRRSDRARADLPEVTALLVNPGMPLATPAVFKARRGPFSPPARFHAMPPSAAELAALLAERRNDLTARRGRMMPEIAAVLRRLGGPRARCCRA